jgi:S-adenosylmethionine decarboxylase
MKQIEGTHLIVDGYVHDADQLGQESMFSLFDALVETLGMRYLTHPKAHRIDLSPKNLDNVHEDDGGWSYWCTITTSHIAAHTWPLRRAVMLDVFSCRPFDFKLALSLIRERLGMDVYQHHVVHRSDPRKEKRSASVCSLARARK